jgi:hypothetical protein
MRRTIGSFGHLWRIKLSNEAEEQIALHLKACHHHSVLSEDKRSAQTHREFHRERYLAHLRRILEIVYTEGDFSEATSKETSFAPQMIEREAWDPDRHLLPDHEMFGASHADTRFPIGKPHAADALLVNLRPAVSMLKQRGMFDPNRRGSA